MKRYSHITSRCFVNAPFSRLDTGLLDLMVEHGIQPEIGLEGDVLYSSSMDDFKKVAAVLRENNLKCTLHAPFLDLSPGSADIGILEATRRKLRLAFDLIPIFQPESIVCHLGYEDIKHRFRKKEWLAVSLATWGELTDFAGRHNTRVMLENTFESSPEQHRKILESLDSPFACFCLDVGHVNAFARNKWQDWLPELSPWLGQLHLHDNSGDHDNHLAIGSGTFDFIGLFTFIKANALKPIITLEPHQEDGLWDSLESLDKLKLFTQQE